MSVIKTETPKMTGAGYSNARSPGYNLLDTRELPTRGLNSMQPGQVADWTGQVTD